jgi:outer membrane protein assembly factor BamB
MPRIIPILTAVLAVGSLAGSAQSAGWHQWRGTNRDGKSAETGLLRSWPPEGPSVAWRTSGAGTGFSSFSSAGGRLYTLGDRAKTAFVVAFDAATGKRLWETPTGRSYFNSYGDGQRGTPTSDGDRLYALGANGDLVCLNPQTGAIIWQKNLPREFRSSVPQWGYAESPLIVGDRLIVNAGGPNASIVALNKMTGDVLWRSQSDPAAYSSPVVAEVGGVTQVVFFSDRRSLGLDVRDGRLLWSYDRASNGTANIATPVVSGNRVFVSSNYGTGAALLEISPSGAKELYFTRNMRNHHSSSVLVGEHVYGFSDAILTALKFADGTLAWRDRSVGKGSLIYADERLYLYSENGVVGLAEANPTAYREHGRFKLPVGREPTWSHPIITDGKLILRDQDNVYAFNVRAGRSG